VGAPIEQQQQPSLAAGTPVTSSSFRALRRSPNMKAVSNTRAGADGVCDVYRNPSPVSAYLSGSGE